MNANTATAVYEIPIDRIEFFIKRRRNRAKWEAMRDSMASMGLKLPIEVRSIAHLPKDQRKRPEGGYYEFQLIWGQGRIEAAQDLGWKTIPAFIVEANDLEAAGRFMVENTDRLDLTAYERGELISRRMDAGASLEEVASRLSISLNLAGRYLRAFGRTAEEVREAAKKLPMNALEDLTSLPAEGQSLVMEVVRETGVPIEEVTKRAKRTARDGKVSKTAIKAEISDVKRKLEAIKKRLAVLRVHDSIGPQLLEQLASRPDFYDACIEAGINPSIE